MKDWISMIVKFVALVFDPQLTSDSPVCSFFRVRELLYPGNLPHRIPRGQTHLTLALPAEAFCSGDVSQANLPQSR